MEERMPCSPRDLKIYPYVLIGTLGWAESEEAAARVITFSQQLDQWVGVSWPRILEMMQQDYELHQKSQEVRHHNLEKQWRVARELRRRRIFCILTLGLYTLFVSKPTAQMHDEPTEKVPVSTIFLMGPQGVVNGIHELIEKGMLRHVQEDKGESILDVFFPTPALIARIMQKQGVTAS